MTLTLDLPPDMEALLQAEAARRGVPVQEYALEALGLGIRTDAADTGEEITLPRTGAEALAYWKREGVLGLFGDRPDTPEFARELRRQAETRGRLIERDTGNPDDS